MKRHAPGCMCPACGAQPVRDGAPPKRHAPGCMCPACGAQPVAASVPRVIELVIPGQPQPKERPQTVRRGGKSRTFTPEATSQAEDAIRYELLGARVRPTPQDVQVELHFYVRQNRGDKQQPDIDNCEKLVLDACNKFAWEDDSQVVEKHSYLHRSDPNPRTTLRIQELT